jgi:hypothetical protein
VATKKGLIEKESSKVEQVRSLMSVAVQIGDRRFEEDLAEQALIKPDIDSLNEALATNPGRFGEWAMLEALARTEHDGVLGQVAVVETDVKDLEAELYLKATTPPDPLPAGWKSPTVDGAKAMVNTDPARRVLVKKKQALEEAGRTSKGNLEVLIAGRKTIEAKKESLLALASNWRQEMQTKLAVGMEKYRPGGR